MTITNSFIILATAIGAVAFLFISDYYYRHLDSKSMKLPLVKLDVNRDIEPMPALGNQNNQDKNLAA